LPVEGVLSPGNERSEMSGEAPAAPATVGALSPNNCEIRMGVVTATTDYDVIVEL
jgi:hypothetical protein